eukprot:337859-Pelagomonas_calceolata.AAC.1
MCAPAKVISQLFVCSPCSAKASAFHMPRSLFLRSTTNSLMTGSFFLALKYVPLGAHMPN